MSFLSNWIKSFGAESLPPTQKVLVVGGTGRTGSRLVQQLRSDPKIQVTVLARDPAKAAQLFQSTTNDLSDIQIIHGDLTDVPSWSHHLQHVDQVVTLVSSGLRTNPFVLLGILPEPANISRNMDHIGISHLADAAAKHGVKRIVAVTTASAGTAYSPAAMFLNAMCYMSVKWKFEGEQRIRASGLDYVVIRPYGLIDTEPAGSCSGLGVEFAQTRETPTGRRFIPREDVASLCRQALKLPLGVEGGGGGGVTFECWATNQHTRPVDWSRLERDPIPLPHADHDTAVAVGMTGLMAVTGILGYGGMRGTRLMLGILRRKF